MIEIDRLINDYRGRIERAKNREKRNSLLAEYFSQFSQIFLSKQGDIETGQIKDDLQLVAFIEGREYKDMEKTMPRVVRNVYQARYENAKARLEGRQDIGDALSNHLEFVKNLLYQDSPERQKSYTIREAAELLKKKEKEMKIEKPLKTYIHRLENYVHLSSRQNKKFRHLHKDSKGLIRISADEFDEFLRGYMESRGYKEEGMWSLESAYRMLKDLKASKTKLVDYETAANILNTSRNNVVVISTLGKLERKDGKVTLVSVRQFLNTHEYKSGLWHQKLSLQDYLSKKVRSDAIKRVEILRGRKIREISVQRISNILKINYNDVHQHAYIGNLKRAKKKGHIMVDSIREFLKAHEYRNSIWRKTQ